MLNLIQIRKDLHQIPEVGFQEWKTQEYLLNHLKKWEELEITTFDFPGIVCVYKNAQNEPFTIYRSDMDALPITEETSCDFKSTHDGVMHACGHDIHMTVLLGLIERVVTEKIQKNIIFIYQPAEEGKGGAEKLIATKILEKFNIEKAFALHVSGDFPIGTVASKAGIIFGIPQEFIVEFRGKGAHVAFPDKGNDALLAGINFYQNMLSAISHRFSPMDPIMFHVGEMEAGNVMNQIPDFCTMEGTFRVLTKKNREKLKKMIPDAIDSSNKLYGTFSTIDFPSTFDPVVNNKDLVAKFKENLPENIKYRECETQMTGEDFGFFTTMYPGCLFWLGAGTREGLHSPKFLPHEKCIEIGVQAMYSTLG